jgi:hypothetical protein
MIAGTAKQGVIFLDNKTARMICAQSEDASYKKAVI